MSLFSQFFIECYILSQLFLTDTQNLWWISLKLKLKNWSKGNKNHWNDEIADWILLNGKK